MAKFAVILPAAGRSSRYKDKNYKKPFAPLANRAVWIHSAERFLNRDDVAQVILVIAPEDRDDFNFKFASNVAILGIDVVEGGAERSDSVEAALSRVKPEADFVCIHDAARPCLADVWIDAVFEEARRTGAAILAIPAVNTLKRVGANHRVEETLSRKNVYEVQTPQVFARAIILEAYARRAGFVADDDAQLVERLGKPVAIVPGSPVNIKITTRDDLRFAEAAMKALPKPRFQGPAHPFADDDMWR